MASGSSMESGLSGASVRPAIRIAPSITKCATWIPCGASSGAVPFREHRANSLLSDQEAPESGDGQSTFDIGGNEVGQGPAVPGAGVVDDHIRTADLTDDLIEKTHHVLRAGCITHEWASAGLAAQC